MHLPSSYRMGEPLTLLRGAQAPSGIWEDDDCQHIVNGRQSAQMPTLRRLKQEDGKKAQGQPEHLVRLHVKTKHGRHAGAWAARFSWENIHTACT